MNGIPEAFRREEPPASVPGADAPPAVPRQRVFATRDDILKADDRPVEEVEVPEWGFWVRVRGLTGRERDEFEASTMVIRDGKAYPDTANVRAKLIARCVINEDGTPMFTQHDVHALGEKSGRALDRIFFKASELSGLSDEDLEKIMGNSEAAPGGDSASASPSGSAAQLKNFSPASPATS